MKGGSLLGGAAYLVLIAQVFVTCCPFQLLMKFYFLLLLLLFIMGHILSLENGVLSRSAAHAYAAISLARTYSCCCSTFATV